MCVSLLGLADRGRILRHGQRNEKARAATRLQGYAGRGATAGGRRHRSYGPGPVLTARHRPDVRLVEAIATAQERGYRTSPYSIRRAFGGNLRVYTHTTAGPDNAADNRKAR